MTKILIVDDEEMIRETLKDIIVNEGYNAEEAKDYGIVDEVIEAKEE